MDRKEERRLYREKWIEHMKGDFDPKYSPGSMPQVEHRIANAAEYSAYQLGRTAKALEEISETLKAIYVKM